jgi:hypothetical protein
LSDLSSSSTLKSSEISHLFLPFRYGTAHHKEYPVTIRLLILVSLFVVVAVVVASGTTILVDDGGGGDFTAIKPALAASAEGDTVLVMPGTYVGTNNVDLDFAGTNVVLRSSGGSSVTTIDCGNDARVFMLQAGDADASTVIEGFTFTAGNKFSGGLAYIVESSPTFVDCLFSSSFALYGGAVYFYDSASSFTNCMFAGNSSAHGGAMQVERAAPTFTDCTFDTNTSTGEAGGVDCIWDATPTFLRCTFTGNNCALDGGGLRCYDGSSPIVTDCDFTYNYNERYGGGAFCDSTSSPVFTNCTFTGNVCNSGGGAHARGNSAPSFAGCVFTGNSCTYGGGAVDVESATASFETCDFLGNAAKWGGAVYCYGHTTFAGCLFVANEAQGSGSEGGAVVCDSEDSEFTSCTFSDNSTEDVGGAAIHCWDANPTIDNCIVAFSIGGPGVGCDTGSENPILSCCDLYGNSGGDWVGCIADQDGVRDNIAEDPLFCDRPGDDFTIDATSGCAAAHSGGCGLIGALGVGCDSPVEETSWGAIKSMYR